VNRNPTWVVRGKFTWLAVLTTPWIDQHLLLFARTLWRRR